MKTGGGFLLSMYKYYRLTEFSPPLKNITFFVPYKRAGTHFSIHPAKRQYTPPSKKSQKSLENQNSYNWWSKSQVKKRFMPGYTGILSTRTYLSSSLHLQLADSLFKPTFATLPSSESLFQGYNSCNNHSSSVQTE